MYRACVECVDITIDILMKHGLWAEAKGSLAEGGKFAYICIVLRAVLDLSGGLGGLTPLWCLSTPQVCIDPLKKIVKISQKYIAELPLVFPQIGTA